METHVGRVTHWYNKIGVAALDLDGRVTRGDHVKVRKGDAEFDDTIASIEIDHVDVPEADVGDNATVKLSHAAKEGSDVYRVA
jgi:hypothetical protein